MTAEERYTATAVAASAVVIGRYSSSFSLATRLLPVRVRADIASLYALVRIADEVVDGGCPADRAPGALDELERETGAAIAAGFSTNPVVHAFALVARGSGFGTELTAPFFAAMRADLHPRPHTAASLADYIRGSAEAVGLMCLAVFLRGTEPGPGRGYADLEPGARALGAALQKINFLRDVDDDTVRLGRDYFPGASTGTPTGPLPDGAVPPSGTSAGGAPMPRAAFDRFVADAEADLNRGAAAAELLPADVRPAVRTVIALYRELLARIRAAGPVGVRATRIRVPAIRKLRLALPELRGTRPAPR